MAKLAFVLHYGAPAPREVLLSRVLDFFGVPWEFVAALDLAGRAPRPRDCAVFGSTETVAGLLDSKAGSVGIADSAGIYVYSNGDGDAARRILTRTGCGNISLREAPSGDLAIRISKDFADFAGPMTGLRFSAPLGRRDAIFAGHPVDGRPEIASMISAGDDPVFLRFQHQGVPFYFCSSSHMVDIDDTLGPEVYDVKRNFCSVAPLVMFIKHMFPDVGWHPQEIGACLIVDDPLLRRHYGFCDFGKLRDLMGKHGFTTNIAFIPWNWRRTSAAASEFFRSESEYFSISIHGCDHTGAEFGSTSPRVLENRARLAQLRMENHEARTGIHHDRIMVFPQGVFSSVCPQVLKTNGFLAAVNTETVPVDPSGACTRIRDVWDVAIMSYGDFPIFTRRYSFHGLENFAFDLLLGKPSLTVSHHEFFRGGAQRPVEWVEDLHTLNCALRWRSLGEVVRRACRRRTTESGREEVEMYGNELIVGNPSNDKIEVRVRKREAQAELVSEVRCDAQRIQWSAEDGRLTFGGEIGPGVEKRFQVVYRVPPNIPKVSRSLPFEMKVAARRILSEFRDDYVSRSAFLASTAAAFKRMLTRSS